MQVKMDEEGNYLRLVAEGTWESGYRNLEAMLKASGTDPAVWRVTSHRLNTWPTTGFHEGAPWTVINWQVKADLVRRKLEPLAPQVQPVAIRARRGPRTKPGRRHHGLETALAVMDLHCGFRRDLATGELTPFHDRRVLDIALQLAIRLRPELIVFAGDILDLPEWSDKFVRSPEFYWATQPAVVEAAWWLGQFRVAVPGARIVVLEGNHDARLEAALLTHLNQVYQLRPADELALPPALSIPRLLALHKFDIEYVDGYPDNLVWLGEDAIITHGSKVRSGPGATAGAIVRETDVTEIHGHIHRRERAARTIRGRHGERIVESFCPGCACHTDYRTPGHHRGQSWQQGLAVVRWGPGVPAEPVAVAVREGKAQFEGEIYEAVSHREQMREDTGWAL